jgi:hypothetical protein
VSRKADMSPVEVSWQQKCCTEKRVLIVPTLKSVFE